MTNKTYILEITDEETTQSYVVRSGEEIYPNTRYYETHKILSIKLVDYTKDSE